MGGERRSCAGCELDLHAGQLLPSCSTSWATRQLRKHTGDIAEFPGVRCGFCVVSPAVGFVAPQYNDLEGVDHHGGKALFAHASSVKDLLSVDPCRATHTCNNLGTYAVLLLCGFVLPEAVSTCWKIGGDSLYEQLCLCTLLASDGTWGGNRGT